MGLKQRIADLHYRSSRYLPAWAWLLFPMEAVYRLIVQGRLTLYRQGLLKSFLPPVPVISVGNLTTGGTGKTPVVIAIASGLIKAGKTVVILSRGYGAETPLDYGRALDPRHGDEAYLLQARLPEAVVIVGKDRVQTLQRAVQDYRPDYVLLDDGFQYLRLQRAINLLLIDGERLIGNGHLLPLGPLREPLVEITRADLIFMTKTVSEDSIKTVEGWVKQMRGSSAIPVVPVPFHPAGLKSPYNNRTLSAENLARHPVIAFSGIANPNRFEQDLRSLDLKLLKHFTFEDHQRYDATMLRPLLDFVRQHREKNPVLVTTEKDFPKARPLIPADLQDRVYVLDTVPALDGQWFYHEFLTQMPGYVQTGGRHAHIGGQR